MRDESESNELFRFKGTIDLISHLLNKYARRDWCQAPNSPYLAATYATINKSGVLKRLSKEN